MEIGDSIYIKFEIAPMLLKYVVEPNVNIFFI